LKRLDKCSRSRFENLSKEPRYNKQTETISNVREAETMLQSEFESARRRERQRQRIEAAKQKYKYKGRKTVITKDLIKTIEKYKNLGVSVTEIARITGRSRSTIYKVLKEELGYVSNRLVKQEGENDSK
jgi:DNA invertase Pin-like site-specific DNA recombinase